MTGLRSATRAMVVVLVITVLMTALVPTAAHAQNRQILVETRLTLYPMSFTARSGGSEFGTHGSTMWGLELRFWRPDSRWSFGGEFLTGSQHGGTGSWLNLREGTDRIFSGWVAYNLLPPTSESRVDLWAGYGKTRWETTFASGSRELFRAKGPMIGASFYVPVGMGVDIGGRVSYTFANTELERSTGTTSSTGSTTDYMFNISYERDAWRLLAGYRWFDVRAGQVTGCVDCSFNWSGPFFQVGYTFAR